MRAFDRGLEEVKGKILDMSRKVLWMLDLALQGLMERDEGKLKRVFDMEDEIDLMENENERELISLLARFQPEAKDLRTMVMFLFINRDLERMGDHAENIAESSLQYIQYPPVKPLVDIPRMMNLASSMLSDSLKSFLEENYELANDVIKRDVEVDNLRQQIIMELTTYMISDVRTIKPSTLLINIAQHIERVADLSTNFAEEVIYILTGQMIKHGGMGMK